MRGKRGAEPVAKQGLCAVSGAEHYHAGRDAPLLEQKYPAEGILPGFTGHGFGFYTEASPGLKGGDLPTNAVQLLREGGANHSSAAAGTGNVLPPCMAL